MPAAPASANRGADSDDWEYEYDDTDTQDLFLTLDLTSHTAVSAPKKGFNKLEHDIFAEEARGKKKSGTHSHEAADDANATLQEQGDQDMEAEEDDDEEDRLHIVGLHHDNPIVSYKGQAYTCKWASTIGTDLFFARAPDADADIDQPPAPAPLRPLGTFNMLGASSTRLVATAAKLRERTSAEQRGTSTLAGLSTSGGGAVAGSSQAPAGNPSTLLFASTSNVPHFYVPPNATRAQKRQASFLENFAAVKARLGETDTVRSTSYSTRSGARTATAAAELFDNAQGDGDAGPSTTRGRAARPSASFLSAQRDANNDSPSANGDLDVSPQPHAASASPSAEPAPTRGRGRSRAGMPRGRGRGRPRGRGRGRRKALVDVNDGDGDAGDGGDSVPTPALWDADAMAGVESASARRGSVGEVAAQQQQQQEAQEGEVRSEDVQE